MNVKNSDLRSVLYIMLMLVSILTMYLLFTPLSQMSSHYILNTKKLTPSKVDQRIQEYEEILFLEDENNKKAGQESLDVFN